LIAWDSIYGGCFCLGGLCCGYFYRLGQRVGDAPWQFGEEEGFGQHALHLQRGRLGRDVFAHERDQHQPQIGLLLPQRTGKRGPIRVGQAEIHDGEVELGGGQFLQRLISTGRHGGAVFAGLLQALLKHGGKGYIAVYDENLMGHESLTWRLGLAISGFL
jgi:hypothetical protein